MNRRNFLKTTTSSIGLAAIPTMFIGVKPARAELATIIMVVIAIVTAVASMFRRPDGTRQLFAVLDAKLDAVIKAQEATLQSIRLLSESVDALTAAIPEFLIQEDLRNIYTGSSDILTKLEASLQVIEAEGPSAEIENILDVLVERAWNSTGEFYQDLQTINAGHEQDLGLINYCTRIIHVQRDFLAAFKAADRAIGKEEERAKAHRQKYRDIADSTAASIFLFRTRHLSQSKNYHDEQNLSLTNVISGNVYTQQWTRHLNSLVPTSHSESRLDFSVSSRFTTIQSFGPCTHGYNSDDINWARNLTTNSFFGLGWTAYEQFFPAAVSGTSTYYQDKLVGYAHLVIQPGQADRTLLAHGTVDQMPRKPSIENDNFFAIPMNTAEFNCPGVAANDALIYSHLFARYGRDNVISLLPHFHRNMTKLTQHRWASIAATLIDGELNSVLVDAEKSKETIWGS